MKPKDTFFQKKHEKGQVPAKETQIITLILFLAFFVMTFAGAGSFLIVSLTGLFLCCIGLMQSSVRVDLWMLLFLLLYNGISFLSGYRIYGNTLEGLASTQSIFPVVYLLKAYLDGRERVLLKRLCAVWVGIMGAAGIGQFVWEACFGSASRLSGLMGNPNAMGAMLALGWFALRSCQLDLKENERFLRRCLGGLECIVLASLALTLSVGAFGALGIGVIAAHIYGKETFSSLMANAAELVFAVGSGVLLYMAGDTAGQPWLCLVLCLYILAEAWYWNEFRRFLKDCRWARVLLCLAGICGAAVLIFLRPNASATFAERLAMIRNGIGYLTVNPLLGLGPYQWRLLNMQDGDLYFNTWHIHNIFVHVGVELGWIAAAMLIAAAVRHIRKREDKAQRGAFFAALIHNLFDTSFFYIATVPFLIMLSSYDERKERVLGGAAAKCVFGIFAALFGWNTLQCF